MWDFLVLLLERDEIFFRDGVHRHASKGASGCCLCQLARIHNQTPLDISCELREFRRHHQHIWGDWHVPVLVLLEVHLCETVCRWREHWIEALLVEHVCSESGQSVAWGTHTDFLSR